MEDGGGEGLGTGRLRALQGGTVCSDRAMQ